VKRLEGALSRGGVRLTYCGHDPGFTQPRIEPNSGN